MNFRAVIFDMDGVLIDTELLWGEQEKMNIWPKLGLDYDTMGDEFVGLKLDDAADLIKEKYSCVLSRDEIKQLYLDAAKQVYAHASFMPGAETLLKRLKNEAPLLGLATSSPMEWVKMFLERFNLEKYFDYIASTDSMNLVGKPDPAIYQFVMEKFVVDPSEAVIFEDSFAGFTSARLSGASVVAVPDSRWSVGDFSPANLVAKGLEDERIYSFIGLNPLVADQDSYETTGQD